MQDCKLDYVTLMRDCLDYITTISLAIEDAQNKSKLDETLLQEFDRYSRNLEEYGPHYCAIRSYLSLILGSYRPLKGRSGDISQEAGSVAL